MAELHIRCGLFGFNIYAGTVNRAGTEWKSKQIVTDEAIDAVRDYLRAQIEDDKDCFGYEWNTKDGKIITLFVKIKERDENETD